MEGFINGWEFMKKLRVYCVVNNKRATTSSFGPYAHGLWERIIRLYLLRECLIWFRQA